MTLVLEILPFLLLGGTAVLLAVNWEAIPERFPIHWGLDGTPNGWAGRSVPGVYAPLVIGLLLCAVVLALRIAGVHLLGKALRTGGAASAAFAESQRRFLGRVLLAAEYVVSLSFGATGLLPFLGGPALVLVVALGSAGLLVVYALVGSVQLARAHPPSAGERDHWRCGLFYVNRADPALFVPRRIGLGWTLNFGRRGAWLVLALLVGAPIALAMVLAHLM